MSRKKELREIKAALAKRPKGPGRRIPPELRQSIVCYARGRAGEGASRSKIATEVGVCEATLFRLLEAERPAELVPIRISKAPSYSMTVRGPRGLTIEGLDVEGVAALIRALS